MADQFKEEVVTKRNSGVQTALFIAANVLMILAGILALLNFTTVTSALRMTGFSQEFFIYLIIFLLFTASAVGLYFYRDRIKMEYEYTLTNTQMDFAQVFNNKKRKSLGTMNIKNVEACGLVSSGSFHRYISMQGIKRNNWFLNRDAELFYFFFQKNGEKRIIVIEPSEEMRSMIKRSVPQGVWQNN